jgi:hypothetical protein
MKDDTLSTRTRGRAPGRPVAIRRVVAIPMVGPRLRCARTESPDPRWETAGRHVDKTSVGPESPARGEGPNRPVQAPTDPRDLRPAQAGILSVVIRISMMPTALRSGSCVREETRKAPKKFFYDAGHHPK